MKTSLKCRVIPSLLAQDIGRTVEFYRRLGFELSACDDERDATWVEMRRDEIVLQFFSDPPKGMQGSPVMSGTLYFTPADVLGLAKEFRDVPFEWGPEVMEYGMREFAIRDPNGYLLAFTEPA